MNVVVLLAGIVDTKWPLRGIQLGSDGIVSGDDKLPRKFGPFDEAALETALKLRDADPGASITALLLGAAQGEQLLRTAAAFRLQRLSWIEHDPAHRWDVSALAQTLKLALEALDPRPDLVLMGREVGDCDDGTLPPYLAEALGRRFVGLVQEIVRDDGALKFRRARGNADEWLKLSAPVVASVTNDKSNRLRHPLLKNVMAAKRETFTAISSPQPHAAARLVPGAIQLQESSQRQGGNCRIVTGPVERQVADLAAYLKQWRGEP